MTNGGLRWLHSIIHLIRLDLSAVNSLVRATCKLQEIDVNKSNIYWLIKVPDCDATLWPFLVAAELLKTLGTNPYLVTVYPLASCGGSGRANLAS
jgi:hypothetical protein